MDTEYIEYILRVHSNYWTAVMYFRHENGSYKRVPQYPNAQLGYEGCVFPNDHKRFY